VYEFDRAVANIGRRKAAEFFAKRILLLIVVIAIGRLVL
jgi:hypothetical protein